MKASKGDTVYILNHWNNFNQCCIEKAVVKSWGKKQATAYNAKSGEMLEEFIRLIDGENVKCFATREEAHIAGMVINAERIEWCIADKLDTIERCMKGGRDIPDYLAKELSDFGENGLRVVDINEWRKEQGFE